MEALRYKLSEASFDRTQLFVPKHQSHRRTLSSIGTENASRDSSLNHKLGWNDTDYLESGSDSEREGDLSFESDYTRPPSTSGKGEAIRQHTHTRSLSTYLPFRSSTSKSPERSPQRKAHEERGREEAEFMATLTGDRDGVIKVSDKNKGGLSSWFSGSSAPVALGPASSSPPSSPPTPPQSNTFSSPSKPRPGPQTLDSTLAMQATPSKSPGMFSFLTPKKSPVKESPSIQLPAHMMEDDELLSLDINTALFPNGQAADPFSPASFKNLLMNAEGLLLKLQTAYKLRTLSLHELSAETSACDEELEEAETRAQCLKNQLEEMAHRVQSQDAAMEELVLQLAHEKQLRAEEREMREKSIAMVKAGREREMADEEGNLGKKWRLSAESDTESAAESVFSRSRSPTSTMSIVSDSDALTIDTTPEICQASMGRMVSVQNQNQGIRRPGSEKQSSTFERMMDGMVNTDTKGMRMMGEGEEGCLKCNGKGDEANVAWDAVGMLRVENQGLKARVHYLEDSVDDTLDLLKYLARG